MNVAIVVGIILVVLFLVAYVTKRRFGVLGLALTAGAMLSQLWAKDVTPYVRDAGLVLVAPPLETVVAAVLVLLPAVVLLFSGPKYEKGTLRIVGAAAFAVLASAFLLVPLGDALVMPADSQQVFDFLVTHRVWIVTAGIVFAVVDLLMATNHKAKKEH